MEQTSPTVIDIAAHRLTTVLANFKVNGKVISIKHGPTVTTYEFQPEVGVKASKIIGLANDIARCMMVTSVRISTLTGSDAVGIELPNKARSLVLMSELLETEEWKKYTGNIPIVLGRNMLGQPVIVDLAKMPHLLIAGTTGSGKSVGIHTIITSILNRFTSQDCRFILIDPKMLEMSQYTAIPHLLTPVITEPTKAIAALKWAVVEMERRYRLMQSLHVQNIKHYNETIKNIQSDTDSIVNRVQTGYDDNGEPEYEDEPQLLLAMPYIVIVIDEVANLILQTGKQTEIAIQQLSQMARAAGIHLIVATQRPSVDVITGTIKANLPTRISFKVQSKIDSRTILGEQGAEQLLGNGDMLMLEGVDITRIQGAFIDDKEIKKLVDFHSKGLVPINDDMITNAENL